MAKAEVTGNCCRPCDPFIELNRYLRFTNSGLSYNIKTKFLLPFF